MAEWAEGEGGECAEEGCDREAAVAVDVPWDENRVVCTAHARSVVQRDGVVAMPLEEAREEWQ